MLRLGAASADITPDRPLIMAGFGQRRPFDGVAHRIKARVIVFERAGVRAVLVSADLLRWSPAQVESLRERLREAVKVEPTLLLLSATHTHCAPQTSMVLAPLQPAADPRYLAAVEDRVVDAACIAAERLEPVTVGRSGGECGIGINRRLWRNGQVAMAPNPDGPTDPDLTVVEFRRRDGNIAAILVHYTCHPTTSAQNFISPDFPGTAMDLLEREMGGRSTAAFLQGCCGDVRPRLVEDGRFFRGTQDDVIRLAGQLAAAVTAAVNGGSVSLGECDIEGIRKNAELPYARLPTSAELHRRAQQDDADGRWAQRLLANSDWHRGHADLEVSRLTVADGLSFLALNAEPVVEYGFAIRALGKGAVLPVGYSNGMLGYLPTAQQLAEGGYEADQSTRAYGLPGRLGPDTERIALEAITEVLAPH